jgi:hypothetical protein
MKRLNFPRPVSKVLASYAGGLRTQTDETQLSLVVCYGVESSPLPLTWSTPYQVHFYEIICLLYPHGPEATANCYFLPTYLPTYLSSTCLVPTKHCVPRCLSCLGCKPTPHLVASYQATTPAMRG